MNSYWAFQWRFGCIVLTLMSRIEIEVIDNKVDNLFYFIVFITTFFYASIQSFNEWALKVCHMPDTVLGHGDTVEWWEYKSRSMFLINLNSS